MLTPKRILHFNTEQNFASVSMALTQLLQLTAGEAQQLLDLGAVYLNSVRLQGEQPLMCGQYLRVHLQPKRFALPPFSPRVLIQHETNDFLVAYKPRNLPTHSTLDNARENLRQFLSNEVGQLYPIQRLDQFTAGTIVFAKTRAFARHFTQQLKLGLVNKFYVAKTSRALQPGLVCHYMKPSTTAPREVCAEPRPGWKLCKLQILSSVALETDQFRNEIKLVTGRTHQIRAQLAALKAPLIGDHLYGAKDKISSQPSLIASQIEFLNLLSQQESFILQPDLLKLDNF